MAFFKNIFSLHKKNKIKRTCLKKKKKFYILKNVKYDVFRKYILINFSYFYLF